MGRNVAEKCGHEVNRCCPAAHICATTFSATMGLKTSWAVVVKCLYITSRSQLLPSCHSDTQGSTSKTIPAFPVAYSSTITKQRSNHYVCPRSLRVRLNRATQLLAIQSTTRGTQVHSSPDSSHSTREPDHHDCDRRHAPTLPALPSRRISGGRRASCPVRPVPSHFSDALPLSQRHLRARA